MIYVYIYCENVIVKLLAQKKVPKRLRNTCRKQNVFFIYIYIYVCIYVYNI